MSAAIETRLICQNTEQSPLGRVVLAGYIKNSVGLPDDPMRILANFALVYILDGGGVYQDVNRNRAQVSAGDLLFIFPGVAHSYRPLPGGHWSEIYIVFNGPVFDLWRKQSVLNVAKPVHHLEPVDYWMRRFEETVWRGHNEPVDPLNQVCRLQQLLSDVLAVETRAVDQSQPEWLATARQLLESPEHASWDLPDIAANVGLTYELFRKRFAEFTGLAPARYRARRVMERACDLMRDATVPTRQIAEACGFCDEFHFSRRFKQIVGLSPTEYRKRVGGGGRGPKQ